MFQIISPCNEHYPLFWNFLLMFPGRWRQRHIPGHQARCCSRRGERIQLQRAQQRIRLHQRSHSLLAPLHMRLGLLYPAEYRLPTPNSCAELDETRRPSSDPPFMTTPERGCRGSCFTMEDRDLKILVQWTLCTKTIKFFPDIKQTLRRICYWFTILISLIARDLNKNLWTFHIAILSHVSSIKLQIKTNIYYVKICIFIPSWNKSVYWNYFRHLYLTLGDERKKWNDFLGIPKDHAAVRDKVSRSFLRCSPKFRMCQTVF